MSLVQDTVTFHNKFICICISEGEEISQFSVSDAQVVKTDPFRVICAGNKFDYESVTLSVPTASPAGKSLFQRFSVVL